jgi:predicted RNase H-like HicB family nuclease
LPKQQIYVTERKRTISELTKNVMPRGGARENSGRKPKWNLGETKAIRVPLAIADLLLEIARRIDEGETLESIIPQSEVNTPKLSSVDRRKNTDSLTIPPQQLTQLTLNVLIENEENGVSATVLGLPDCKAKGTTRQEAVATLHQLLTARLAQAEIVPLEIDAEDEMNSR